MKSSLASILLSCRSARTLYTSALILTSSFSAGASIITFDDIPANYVAAVPGTYEGMTWQGFEVLNVPGLVFLDGSTAPYGTSAVSSPNVAFNDGCDAATQAIADSCNVADFSAASPFSLDSAFLAGAYNDGLNVLVTGYLGGSVVDSATLTVSYSAGAELFNFDWQNVDKISFESWGGTRTAGCCGHGSDFTLDNLTVDVVSSEVPEPSTLVFLRSALVIAATYEMARRLRRIHQGPAK